MLFTRSSALIATSCLISQVIALPRPQSISIINVGGSTSAQQPTTTIFETTTKVSQPTATPSPDTDTITIETTASPATVTTSITTLITSTPTERPERPFRQRPAEVTIATTTTTTTTSTCTESTLTTATRSTNPGLWEPSTTPEATNTPILYNSGQWASHYANHWVPSVSAEARGTGDVFGTAAALYALRPTGGAFVGTGGVAMPTAPFPILSRRALGTGTGAGVGFARPTGIFPAIRPTGR